MSFTSMGDHGACQLAQAVREISKGPWRQGISTLPRVQSLELLLAGDFKAYLRAPDVLGAGLGHAGCEKFSKELLLSFCAAFFVGSQELSGLRSLSRLLLA